MHNQRLGNYFNFSNEAFIVKPLKIDLKKKCQTRFTLPYSKVILQGNFSKY